MRKPFFNNLLKLARKDKDIILLVGDLGYSFIEEFQRELPDQFINCGIAEQNMIGVASGLAMSGKKPYCYSGSIFLIMRAYEQVRDDVCYNNTNVKLIGTGASPFLGFSHNCSPKNEDELILKHLPNLKLHFPKDEAGLKRVITGSYNNKKPTYIRL